MKFTIVSIITLLSIVFTTHQASARPGFEINVGPSIGLNIFESPRERRLRRAHRKCRWLLDNYERTGHRWHKRRYRQCIRRHTY